MDECFNDFLTDAERHTRKDLLESNPGLIILRAYTKMYAVPGVRFGWCMTADAALIEKLYHAGQPWNVSVIAQACAARRQTSRTGPLKPPNALQRNAGFYPTDLQPAD